MRRLKTIMTLLLLLTIPAMAQQSKGDTTTYSSADTTQVGAFDWRPAMDAIIWLESKGNPRARCGIYAGAMQISPGLVRECNNILKARGEERRFTLDDRYSLEKSKEMFILMMSKYNPENNIDKAFRIWNGGVRYSVRKTQGFVNKARRYMKAHKNDYQ
jgi:hypothetical protein